LNYWSGRIATLIMSESGKAALGNIFDGDSIEVFVQWADDLGLWVLQEAKDEVTTTVALVKWGHFETAMLDVVLEEPQQPKVIGFGRRQSSN
jgi:hypothetical protein